MHRSISFLLMSFCALVATSAFAQATHAQSKPSEPNQAGSVRPGINDRFIDPNLNVDDFVQRFEIESREVFSARFEVIKNLELKPGARIADVGAGTGLYTRLFAREVGPRGWVYAIDIAPRFLEHINAQMARDGIRNVTSVLCSDKSCGLPPQSVDHVFICDTYHHFEFPDQTLASLLRALKPGGKMAVIDFKRIPGTSREWIVNHVRAGKETFRNEIEQAGFEFIAEKSIHGFDENYFMVFRRPMTDPKTPSAK